MNDRQPEPAPIAPAQGERSPHTLPWALSLLIFGATGAFAAWTLCLWLATALGWTPRGLGDLAPVVFLAMLAFATGGTLVGRRLLGDCTGPGDAAFRAAGPNPLPWRRLIVALPIAAAGALAFLAGGPQWALWGACLAALAPWARRRPKANPTVLLSLQARWQDGAAIVLAAAILWGFNGMVELSNGDDTHFLDAAAAFLDARDLPLFATDTMFQIPERENFVYALNQGQSWESLAGYVAAEFGLDLLLVYHALLPLLAALFIPATWWLFARLLGVGAAAAGLLVAVALVIQLNLGGAMAPGFLEQRLYQGKTTMMTAGLPLAMMAGLLHARRPRRGTVALLALVLVAVGGLSTTGMYMGPLAAGLAVLAFAPWAPGPMVRALAGLCLAALPVLAALVGFHVIGGTQEVMEAYGYPEWRTLLREFGGGLTGRAVLSVYHAAALGVCLAGLWTRRRAAVRFGLAVLVLLLNPWLPDLLGRLTGVMNLYWRYYWLVPIGPLLLILTGTLFDEASSRWAQWRPAPNAWVRQAPVWIVVALVLVLSRATEPLLHVAGGGGIHLTKAGSEARAVAGWFERRAGVLEQPVLAAPEPVAMRVNYYPGAPRQLYLRLFYRSLIPARLEQDLEEHDWLARQLSLGRLSAAAAEEVLHRSARLGVTHVVFYRKAMGFLEDDASRTPAAFRHCEALAELLICGTPRVRATLRDEPDANVRIDQ